MSRQRVCIISGLSGSGKSTAARALEDRGFFVVDNLPLVLLPPLLDLARQSLQAAAGIAVVVDVRTREFPVEYAAVLEQLRRAGYQPEITFFEASDEVLLRRYSETRRSHPLAAGERVQTGIELERKLLQKVRGEASRIIDSRTIGAMNVSASIANTRASPLRSCRSPASPPLPTVAITVPASSGPSTRVTWPAPCSRLLPAAR